MKLQYDYNRYLPKNIKAQSKIFNVFDSYD